MDRDQAYATLGKAIRTDRRRQGLSTQQLVERIRARGQTISARTIGSIERGAVPEQDDAFPSTEIIVAALGWRPGWTDRILAGEDPADLLESRQEKSRPTQQQVTRESVLGMLPTVYAFSRSAVEAGADPRLRDEFDRLAGQLAESLPQSADYALAAYRPHVEGAGPAPDDAERIARALGDA
ncbi:hypothetical protein [Streptomyces boncukensis]|uniref:Uncharacterized protein n=1 Tax=Streptomyces boncukensis TaxID=2711219 RepID=A0A6G4WV55_9ACTN|nr:hypothetical protein [Streptomyces boncukensis]NGO69169.1 hypothetical protein [Streptomyces boncukensis]